MTSTKRHKVFSRRVLLLEGAKLVLLGVVLGRFYHLQIKNNAKYIQLSQKNMTRTEQISPMRGTIFDRNGVIIADNMIVHSALVKYTNATEVSRIIERIESILNRKMLVSVDQVTSGYFQNKSEILLIDNLSWLDICKLEVSFFSMMHQNFYIIEKYTRHYPYHNLLSHTLGYVAKPSTKEMRALNMLYYQGLHVGKDGIEQVFDRVLQGKPGERRYVVDALGKVVQEMPSSLSKKGTDITLSIDVSVQKAVHSAMNGRSGVVIIIKPGTGEVIAMYSYPNYDPSIFANTITPEHWKRIVSDPEKPLLNKAITATYPPGSLFKIVTALAILQAGINPEERVFCTGQYTIKGRTFHCWKKGGHGYINLEQAIARSCNTYFYVQGLHAGIKHIAEAAHILGFGKKTGINLPNEKDGNIPSPEWKKSVIGQRWTYGDTINTAIGQGYVTATPIQFAVMLSRLITKKRIIPVLQSNLQNTETSHSTKNIDIQLTHIQHIMNGMYSAINLPGGTGYTCRTNKLIIAGKTSTAQIVSQRQSVLSRFKEHAIFTGFAPFSNPEYVISVIVEHGGWGSGSALSVAKDLLVDLCTKIL